MKHSVAYYNTNFILSGHSLKLVDGKCPNSKGPLKNVVFNLRPTFNIRIVHILGSNIVIVDVGG